MSDKRRAAVQELLGRILQLHDHGLDSEEIATRILDAEPETALFLTSLLVDLILDSAPQANRSLEYSGSDCLEAFRIHL
jgi:hypothetical protein